MEVHSKMQWIKTQHICLNWNPTDSCTDFIKMPVCLPKGKSMVDGRAKGFRAILWAIIYRHVPCFMRHPEIRNSRNAQTISLTNLSVANRPEKQAMSEQFPMKTPFLTNSPE